MKNQTHKAIIFEEFDGTSSNNLYTLLNNDPSGDRLSSGLEKLTVKNFNEFMAKFAPKVYEVCGKNPQTGQIEFFYTTDPQKFPNFPSSQINISEHAYFKMLSQLYSAKGSSGQSNLKFDDKEILEILTPKKELSEVRDIRQKWEYNVNLLNEAKARGDKSEMSECREKIIECRKKVAEYAKSSLNKLLPILIDDTDKKLKLLSVGTNSNGTNNETKSLPKPTFGMLYLNSEGKLDIDEKFEEKKLAALKAAEDEKSSAALVSVKDNSPAEITNLPAKAENVTKNVVPDVQTVRNKIALTVMKDYDENAENFHPQIKSLIVSAFSPLANLENSQNNTEGLNKEALISRKQNLEDAYVNARKSFANEMSKIVESLLGVKAFFDHATAEGGEYSEIPGGVIIANCKASRLLNIKDKFSSYMKLLGKDQTESRIWFAVLPNVLESPPIKKVIEEDDDDDGMGGSLNDEKNDDSAKVDDEYVSINTLKTFLQEMEKAKIVTVFSIRTKKGNTFSDLTSAEVENKMKTLSSDKYGGHAVYAYPNFTLIRERIFKPFDDENSEEITLPGIFIDAAYPAAGLLVASQQHKVLDNRKLKYDKDSPCVGVDLENLVVKKALSTKFNRESVLRRSEDLIKTINQNMFGFAFSGDEVRDESGVWNNSYIHCARTLAKNERTGIYKPVYQTLTEDFIAQDLTLLPTKKKSDVQKRIKKINTEWKEKNQQTRFSDIVNFLLRTDEEIRLNDEGDKIKIIVHFEGGDGYVDVEVESD
ncbi:MAG: hypothetical protein IK062_03050 [Selenomonadaceae bacterium]|nr:hypothetical protein [Selenomonadaceae bacterium]